MWLGRGTRTAAASTPSATWPRSGTARGSSLRGSQGAGDPWTRGDYTLHHQVSQHSKLLRYIYWNAHFFGENFYGWSIGDRQSLVESGPFHSQGRAGASTHPWQGVWNGNVSVTLVSCNIPRPTIRWVWHADCEASDDDVLQVELTKHGWNAANERARKRDEFNEEYEKYAPTYGWRRLSQSIIPNNNSVTRITTLLLQCLCCSCADPS